VKLVERHIISKNHKSFDLIDKLCFLSKNLYNAALYHIKQQYQQSGKMIRYNELEKLFRLSKQSDYFVLPNNSSQQILMLLDKNLKSYFNLLKKYKKSKTSLSGCPKFPKYKDKIKGRNIIIFTCNQFKLKGGFIHFPKKSFLPTIKTLVGDNKIQQVRIIPNSSCYVIEVVYIKNEKELIVNDNKAAIDLGINNLAALSFNNTKKTYLVNGKGIKSINQYHNKKKAELQSDLKKKHNKNSSKKIINLTHKRNNKIKDYLHKSSRFVVNKLKENNISELVVGLNKEWKQSINIGKKNNQTFCSIPHTEFIEQLKYKCQLEGISILINEESYTSKTSALDLEPIHKQEVYVGKRIKRGMFKSKEGILINADLNGSLNIGRKVFGDEYVKGFIANRGYGQYPIRVNSDKCVNSNPYVGQLNT
jgi:putative transposase